MVYALRSRDESPDPITLPSSPIVPHSNRSKKYSPLKSRDQHSLATPSKSFFLAPASNQSNVESPWRVRVTLEASPGPRQRMRKSSPLKIVHDGEIGEEKAPVLRQPRRKRRTQGSALAHVDTTAEVDELAEATSLRRPNREEINRTAHVPVANALEVPHESARKRARARYSHDPGDNTVTENEDFSMISMESLKTAKDSSFVSHTRSAGLATISELPGSLNASVQEVSYLPSSPPKGQDTEPVIYPDLHVETSKQFDAPPTTRQDAEVDAMSWRPSSGALNGFRRPINSHSVIETKEGTLLSADVGWRPSDADRPRDSQTRRDSGQNSMASRREAAIEVSSGESEDEDLGEDIDGQEHVNSEDNVELDLWQEEASRSAKALPNTSAPLSAAHEVEPDPIDPERARSGDFINDLFSDQASKPRRSKIPRTWRRSSGINLSYADSPAQALSRPDVDNEAEESEDEEIERKDSADGSRILTPPQTDDEQLVAPDLEVEPSSEIFQPDAEATRFQSDVIAGDDGDTESEESADDEDEAEPEEVATPRDENDETGLFFQNEVPRASIQAQTPLLNEPPRRRPRPTRRETVDLTGLLNIASSPRKPEVAPKCDESIAEAQTQFSLVQKLAQRKRFGRPIEVQHVEGQTSLETSDHNVAIERVKKFGRKTRPPGSNNQMPEALATEAPQRVSVRQQTSHSAENRDLLHKARSICEENSASNENNVGPSRRPAIARSASTQAAEQNFDAYSQLLSASNATAITASFRSYEERLNLESPAKMRVNFNDSTSTVRLPSPSRHIVPPLFQGHAGESDKSSSLVEKSNLGIAQGSKPGILARFTKNFWSSEDKISDVRQASESSIRDLPVDTSLRSVTSLLEETSLLEGSFPPHLRTALRTRYGVLSSTFPWRLYHMRTLHRLHNSLFSGRKDTLVPSSGPLPRSLAYLVGSQQLSVTEVEYAFTKQHAYVVQAFLSLLVPAHVVEGMLSGEVESLGDRLTGELRGVAARGDTLRRNGMYDSVWTASDVGEWVDRLKGEIGVQFVVRALGDVVAEEQRVRKRRRN